jgi:hypothetical protein
MFSEYGTNAQGRFSFFRLPNQAPCPKPAIPPGEDEMDFDKDHFEDDNEMSPLEDDELGGDAVEIVETEEEEMVIAEEEPEEEVSAPARPVPKPAAKKSAPKKPAKKAKKKPAKKKPVKKKATKKAKKKPAKKKKKR